MKNKLFYIVLVSEAILCVVTQLFWNDLSNLFDKVSKTPFLQIGMGLRKLSLSGSIGNGAAIVIYVAICLIPIGYFLFLCRKRKLFWEDGILILESILLFVVMYLMINPGKIKNLFWVMGEEYGIYQALLGGMLYSTLTGYVVLRIIRSIRSADKSKIYGYMRILLAGCNVVLCYSLFGTLFQNVLQGFGDVRTGNTGAPKEEVIVTCVFLVMKYFVSGISYFLDMVVVCFLMGICREMEKNPYGNTMLQMVHKISKICRISLTVSVVMSMGFHVLELLFGRRLHQLSVQVDIPIFSIGFFLGVLFMAQILGDNRKLQDENDLII